MNKKIIILLFLMILITGCSKKKDNNQESTTTTTTIQNTSSIQYNKRYVASDDYDLKTIKNEINYEYPAFDYISFNNDGTLMYGSNMCEGFTRDVLKYESYFEDGKELIKVYITDDMQGLLLDYDEGGTRKTNYLLEIKDNKITFANENGAFGCLEAKALKLYEE